MRLRLVDTWRDLADHDRGAVVALGNFDGVHRGHQAVIAAAAGAARRLGAELGVVTFEPHPARLFHPTEPFFRLTTLAQQARILDDLGVSRLYRLPFDADLAAMGEADFAARVLCEGLGVRHVAAGFDVTFGRARAGDAARLRLHGERLGFGVTIVDEVADHYGGKTSSTSVREALRQGRTERAVELLGRPFAIESVVEHGDELGRTLGFRTANLPLGDYVRLAHGIYATRTRLPDRREVAGVGYVGRRPTVDKGLEERLEVHLLDFDEDLYGQTLETDLVHFLRGDEKFATLDAMIVQMARDRVAARALLLPDF